VVEQRSLTDRENNAELRYYDNDSVDSGEVERKSPVNIHAPCTSLKAYITDKLQLSVIGLTNRRPRCDRAPVPHYRIAPQKSLPGRQFTGKKPSCSSGRRAGRFTGLFLSTSDILIRGRHINSMIVSFRADFSWGDILM